MAFRRDGRRSIVTVFDMSMGGVQLQGAPFEKDDEFRLVIPNRGEINARVRWSSAGSAGAEFDSELLLEDVVSEHDRAVVRRYGAFSYASNRTFGKRRTGSAQPERCTVQAN
jgi:hypothetical protein